MGIRARSGFWHYRIKVNGREYTDTTDLAATERNRNAAMRVEAAARQKILAGKAHELKLEVMAFPAAADLFLDWCRGEHRDHPATAKRIVTSFASLKVFFAKFSVVQITTGDIEDFKAWRRLEHEVRDITIRHDLHALSVFFQYAQKHNWCRSNLIREIKVPGQEHAVRMHVLTDAEEALYFETIKLKANGVDVKPGVGAHGHMTLAYRQYMALHNAARLMLLQGVRPEELMRARVEDVQGDHWQIRQGKTLSARRRLRLTTEAKGIIEALKMSAVNGWLFPGKHGNHITSFQTVHDSVLRKSKLAFVLYDLRHSFATRAAAAGMPVTTLAAILGHNNLRTVMKYVHVRQDDIDTAMVLFDSKTQEKSRENRPRQPNARTIM